MSEMHELFTSHLTIEHNTFSKELPYEDQPSRLNIFPLDRRQRRGDIIMAHNKFHDGLDLPWAKFIEVRLPISWNRLLIEIVNVSTLDAFK